MPAALELLATPTHCSRVSESCAAKYSAKPPPAVPAGPKVMPGTKPAAGQAPHSKKQGTSSRQDEVTTAVRQQLRAYAVATEFYRALPSAVGCGPACNLINAVCVGTQTRPVPQKPNAHALPQWRQGRARAAVPGSTPTSGAHVRCGRAQAGSTGSASSPKSHSARLAECAVWTLLPRPLVAYA